MARPLLPPALLLFRLCWWASACKWAAAAGAGLCPPIWEAPGKGGSDFGVNSDQVSMVLPWLLLGFSTCGLLHTGSHAGQQGQHDLLSYGQGSSVVGQRQTCLCFLVASWRGFGKCPLLKHPEIHWSLVPRGKWTWKQF